MSRKLNEIDFKYSVWDFYCDEGDITCGKQYNNIDESFYNWKFSEKSNQLIWSRLGEEDESWQFYDCDVSKEIYSAYKTYVDKKLNEAIEKDILDVRAVQEEKEQR